MKDTHSLMGLILLRQSRQVSTARVSTSYEYQFSLAAFKPFSLSSFSNPCCV